MRTLVVLGTRPEVIKLAPVIAALRGAGDTVVCTTGQHEELLAQALQAFDIVPDVWLGVMQEGQSLNALCARLLSGLDEVIAGTRPDWVVVQGDTASAFCGGLAAFQRGARIGHVEAGLRTGDLQSPFPEEAYRAMLARVASHHFAPTIAARDALLAEGVAPGIITVTGNTVVDTIAERLGRFPKAKERDTVLVTCHRRENHTESLSDICAAIARLCALYPRLSFVFPVHYNAAVRGPVLKALSGIANLSLIDPLDYDENLKALGRSRLVITDSGGLQEEAPSFGVPVVVMRDHTERQEGIDAGFATLAGRRRDDIVEAARSWLDHPERTAALANRPNPYGDGRASQRIVAVLHGRTPEPMT